MSDKIQCEFLSGDYDAISGCYWQCENTAKYINPLPKLGLGRKYVCGVHRRVVDRILKINDKKERCIPIGKKKVEGE